jgi:hypothetical protein
MNRLVVGTALVAILVGTLGGYLWWGVPARRAESEFRDAQSAAERVGQEAAELRAQLAAEKSRRQTVEGDLRTVKEMNSRLHLLVSDGKK